MGSNGDFVRFLLGVCLGDGDVTRSLRLGDLRRLADLLDVVDTHVLNGSGTVLEVLDVEVYDLDTQLLHIRHGIFLDLLCDDLPFLNHFLESDGADDLTHIAFQHLRYKEDQLLFVHAEQRLGSLFQQFRVGGYLDVGNAVHGHVDELVGRNRLAGLDIHLHDVQGQLIYPLDERHTESRTSDEYLFPLAQTGHDVCLIGRCLDIPASHIQEQEYGDTDDAPNECRGHGDST